MENEEQKDAALMAAMETFLRNNAKQIAAQKAPEKAAHAASIQKEKHGTIARSKPEHLEKSKHSKNTKPYRDNFGVKRVWSGNKFRPEHHVVWEQHHGPLEEHEAIGHINGDKLDNRIENLKKVHRPFSKKPDHLRKHPVAEALWFLTEMPPLFNWPGDPPDEDEKREWIAKESQAIQWMANRLKEYPLEVAEFLFKRFKDDLCKYDEETKKWTGRNHKP
jgi:hypothetical protein